MHVIRMIVTRCFDVAIFSSFLPEASPVLRPQRFRLAVFPAKKEGVFCQFNRVCGKRMKEGNKDNS